MLFFFVDWNYVTMLMVLFSECGPMILLDLDIDSELPVASEVGFIMDPECIPYICYLIQVAVLYISHQFYSQTKLFCYIQMEMKVFFD